MDGLRERWRDQEGSDDWMDMMKITIFEIIFTLFDFNITVQEFLYNPRRKSPEDVFMFYNIMSSYLISYSRYSITN